MNPFQGHQIFLQHFDNHQALDFVILNNEMQNRRKLMHFEQDNGLKPHFGPFLVILDSSMQNRQKLMHFEQENGLKPHFGPFLTLNGPPICDWICDLGLCTCLSLCTCIRKL